MIQQNIRNAAYELMSDLIFARSEAVKRNTSVTVSKVGTWTGGWTLPQAPPRFGNTRHFLPASRSRWPTLRLTST
jgi:Tfp pilus assembly protein FimT